MHVGMRTTQQRSETARQINAAIPAEQRKATAKKAANARWASLPRCPNCGQTLKQKAKKAA